MRRRSRTLLRTGARCGVALAAAALVAGAGATPPRLVVRPSAPVVGAQATIELRASAKPPVYVTLRPPGGQSSRLRLRRVAPTLWRTTFAFNVAGAWILRAKSVAAFVMVLPLPASTFTPEGAPSCAPPSPANATTREARGAATTGDLWALFGDLAERRQAVIADVVGKETKIVWRMLGSGDATFTAISPDGSHVVPSRFEPHATASNWNRPGDEWSSIFIFTDPGCWHIHVERANNAGDLWLIVRS